MDNNISLPDIRAFVTIAQQGSFTKAAEILASSRAHLSRQLNQLESQLGVKLIIRTTRAQRLTESGQLFFAQCQASLQAIDQAVVALQDDSQELQGKITINCVGGIIGEDILTQIIADFNLLHPGIDVALDLSSPRVDLISEPFDLVVRMGELEDSSLIARKLTDISVQVLASPTYLTTHPVITHPKDLLQHNCLTGSIKRWRFHPSDKGQDEEKESNYLDIQVSGNFSCKSGRALIHAAKNGNGIVRLPQLYCEKEIARGELITVFKQWHAPSVPLYLLYHQNPFQPARLRVLIDYICQQFQSMAVP